MKSVLNYIDLLLSEALLKAGVSESGQFNISKRPDLSDYQTSIALMVSRKYKTTPEAMALTIMEFLSHECFSHVTFVKPGFINVSMRNSWMAEYIKTQPVGPLLENLHETVIIDMGGANIAKAMHVGHLRSLVIGESISRILSEAGHKVIKDTHLGDWGLQMGMLISEMEMQYPEWGYFQSGPYPDVLPITQEELEALYPTASEACRVSDARKALAQKATLDLQMGHPGYYALWTAFRQVSVKSLKKTFNLLDIDFQLFEGESHVEDLVKPMLNDLLDRKIAMVDHGAVVAWLDGQTTPVILQKSDGAALYATTDLACIQDRVKRFHPHKIIYVVDQRQSLHLESVFQLAEKAHYLGTSLLHVGFGTVNGPDGKPFKTREGGVMKLDDLLENAIQKAYRRLPDGLVEDKQKAVNLAQQIAVAGLKFGDLSGHRTSDYVFDIDKILALEGKTGPYLQYACVRIQSLLKKVELSNGDIVVNHPLERNLLLTCVRYQDSFQASYRDLTPHIIADYAFTLARAFNSFYHECPIMHETDLVVKESRIQLCRQVLIILSRCLYLLGIQVPEEM